MGSELVSASVSCVPSASMSLVQHFKSKGPSGFGYGSTAEDVTAGLSLGGRTILVTGCNSGLGLETSRVLALRGARVIGAARTVEKAGEALAGLDGNPRAIACELEDPSSVAACVAALKEDGTRLDAIICNAGIMALPKRETVLGYEKQFFTNHIGHFLLVTGLLDRLTETGRVVMVSSEAHRRAPAAGIELDNLDGARGYDGWKAYGQSKIANLLFAKELGRRLAGTGKTANALHPGVIATNLTRSMSPAAAVAMRIATPLFLKSIPQGAATQVYVATHPDVEKVTGEYWSDCNPKKPRRDANDPALAKKLWDASEKIASEVSARATLSRP